MSYQLYTSSLCQATGDALAEYAGFSLLKPLERHVWSMQILMLEETDRAIGVFSPAVVPVLHCGESHTVWPRQRTPARKRQPGGGGIPSGRRGRGRGCGRGRGRGSGEPRHPSTSGGGPAEGECLHAVEDMDVPAGDAHGSQIEEGDGETSHTETDEGDASAQDCGPHGPIEESDEDPVGDLVVEFTKSLSSFGDKDALDGVAAMEAPPAAPRIPDPAPTAASKKNGEGACIPGSSTDGGAGHAESSSVSVPVPADPLQLAGGFTAVGNGSAGSASGDGGPHQRGCHNDDTSSGVRRRGPGQPPEAIVRLPGGLIRYYALNKSFEAVCSDPRHGKLGECAITRQAGLYKKLKRDKNGKVTAGGRPIGMMGMFCSCGGSYETKEAHLAAVPEFPRDGRRHWRRCVENAPGGIALVSLERDELNGEGSEPEVSS